MFKRSSSANSGFNPITSLLGALIPTIFLSLFLIVGISLMSYGYINVRENSQFRNTSIKHISELKENEIVKFTLTPDSLDVVESAYKKINCVFYKTEWISYYRSSDSIKKSIDKTESGPDAITLISGNNKYRISTRIPGMTLFTASQYILLKNRKTGQYIPNFKEKFQANDNVIEENIILPDEEVLVYGKLSSIKQVNENTKELTFSTSSLPDPFDNLPVFFENLFSTLFNNNLTSYIISTRTDEITANKFKSGEGLGLIAFGAVFCIVPLVLLIAVWWNFIQYIFQKL